jgi:trehalose 6-phosphate phosphatase
MLPGYQAGWAFFLDLDGTLLDLADRPDAVRPVRELPALLRHLHAGAGGALALISGRGLSDIDGLFPGMKLPAAGQHGLERRGTDDVIHVRAFGQANLRQVSRQLERFVSRRPGTLLEEKGYTLALHYRLAPQYAREAQQAADAALQALGSEFELQHGKKVLEIKPGGTDKGTAIEAFMSEAPFNGRVPVFLGDDHTDEHGFDVVNRLGGFSIKVGEGSSIALARLENPAAARAWLGGWVEWARAAGLPGVEHAQPA